MEDNLENLKNYFELLAQIIPLGNWRISLEGTGSHSMSHFAGEPDAYGVCLKIRDMQYADIYINTDKEHTDKYGETWEHTLIHEVLHVVTDELCEHIEGKCPDIVNDPLYCSKVERLINTLSYALYNALEVSRIVDEECCEESCTCCSENTSQKTLELTEKDTLEPTAEITPEPTAKEPKKYLNNGGVIEKPSTKQKRVTKSKK